MDAIRNWWQGFIKSLGGNPGLESQNMTNSIEQGKQIDNSISGMIPTIKNDLEWLIIALVGLLAYVFIFKR